MSYGETEAELALLGTLYEQKDKMPPETTAQIVDELFDHPRCRTLLRLIKESNGPIETHATAEAAQKEKCLIEFTEAISLSLPVEAAPGILRVLQRNAEKRRLQKAGDEVRALAAAGETNRARITLLEHASKPPVGAPDGFSRGDLWAEKLLARLRDLEEGRGAGIMTGWALFDYELNRSLGGGIVPGHLGVIGGRPGSGKSSFMVQLLAQVLRNEPVGVFSFEMTGDALLEKLASPWCSGWAEAKEGRHINSRIMEQATRMHVGQLDRLFIRDDSALTVDRMIEEADRLHAGGCRVFAVDYLQRIDLDLEDPSFTRFGIQRATSALAKHAKERGVCWIVLSQISRGGDAGSGPSLSTLKESGAIEEDAAWVVSIHQCDANNSEQREIRILKNRYGGHGQEIVSVDWRFQRFPLRPSVQDGSQW